MKQIKIYRVTGYNLERHATYVVAVDILHVGDYLDFEQARTVRESNKGIRHVVDMYSAYIGTGDETA